MKTLNLPRVEKQTNKTRDKQMENMEAIACGVQARLEEMTGHSRRVIDTTIHIARVLGVPNQEIERWAAHRLVDLSHDTEKLRDIKSLLVKIYGSSLGLNIDSMSG